LISNSIFMWFPNINAYFFLQSWMEQRLGRHPATFHEGHLPHGAHTARFAERRLPDALMV